MTTASGARTRLALTLLTSPSLLDRAAAQRPSQALRRRRWRTRPPAWACGMAAEEAARVPRRRRAAGRAGPRDPDARREPGRDRCRIGHLGRASRSGPG